MRTKLFFVLAVVAIALVPTRMFAQSSSATASGSATIMVPITITKSVDLNFGSMSSGTVAGTCVLSTGAIRTQGGGVTLVSASPTATNAAFSVGGQGSATYAITLPSSLTVTYGANNMSIDTFTAKAASAASDGTTGTLAAGGTDTFVVGGTLHVDANQAAGTYTANFNVSVAYN